MKRPLIVAAAVIGLASFALRAAEPETVDVDLSNDYELMAFVGNTPAEFVRAEQLAARWEVQRRLGIGPQTIVARAIDNTEGTARQKIEKLGVPERAVAYVYVH